MLNTSQLIRVACFVPKRPFPPNATLLPTRKPQNIAELLPISLARSLSMAIAHRLVAVIKVPGGDDFLVVRQEPPPSLPEEEYQRYVDTDLWDLPSAPLKLLEGGIRSDVVVQGSESCSDKLDLGNFDLDAALKEVI